MWKGLERHMYRRMEHAADDPAFGLHAPSAPHSLPRHRRATTQGSCEELARGNPSTGTPLLGPGAEGFPFCLYCGGAMIRGGGCIDGLQVAPRAKRVEDTLQTPPTGSARGMV